MLEELKHSVYKALIALPRSGLVQGTSGNVSGRDGDYVVIKPSGVEYDSLSPDDLVVVDLSGRVIEGVLKPSVDTSAHLHIYRSVPEIGGVVHTHSTYATVYAVLGRSIPVYLTEIADLFGGPIPVSAYVPPGDEEIGKEFAEKACPGRFQALLMRNHGVFTAGKTPKDALTAALIVEHSARIAYLAEDAGNPAVLQEEEVRKLHERYREGYGQRSDEKG
ncbi:class II aldolase/adducin family protein [Candidatus Bipolaricaulota bacterium]|nr:class II aldolase/adducin family protein [Candidatus Bipolaricaulota bacterium]